MDAYYIQEPIEFIIEDRIQKSTMQSAECLEWRFLLGLGNLAWRAGWDPVESLVKTDLNDVDVSWFHVQICHVQELCKTNDTQHAENISVVFYCVYAYTTSSCMVCHVSWTLFLDNDTSHILQADDDQLPSKILKLETTQLASETEHDILSWSWGARSSEIRISLKFSNVSTLQICSSYSEQDWFGRMLVQVLATVILNWQR